MKALKTLLVAALIAGIMSGCGHEKSLPQPNDYEGFPAEEVEEAYLPPQEKGAIRYSNNIEVLTADEEWLIKDYMDSYFNSLASLEPADPTRFFADGADLQALGNKTVWEILVGTRKAQPHNLSLADYSYDLLVLRSEIKDSGERYIALREDNTQQFAAFPDVISEQKNVIHIFEIIDENEKTLLKRHLQLDSLNFMVMNDFMGLDQATYAENEAELTALIESKNNILADAVLNVENRLSNKSIYQPVAAVYAENPYDRKSAVEYSNQWADKRNNEHWKSYNNMGGNCVNYTSQCLFAGGIPMDYQGEHQWKWYSDNPVSASVPDGRSPAWSSVNEFYRYVSENSGGGIVATPDYNYYQLEEGDIIQMGLMGEWKHAVIISGVAQNPNGEVFDYLINSNTADLRNFPASAYAYTMQRGIKIHGWNN